MAKDYAAISKKIVENIGGVENIASVTHCMTRLRFVVKDEGKINDAVRQGDRRRHGRREPGRPVQIIIGNHVEEAYNEVLKMGDFGEASQVARGEKKEPLTLKKGGQQHSGCHRGHHVPADPRHHRRLHGQAAGHAAGHGWCAVGRRRDLQVLTPSVTQPSTSCR